MGRDSAAKVIKGGMEAYLFGSLAKQINFGRIHMLVPSDCIHHLINRPPQLSSFSAHDNGGILFEDINANLTKIERRKCIRHIHVSLTTRLIKCPTVGNKTLL